MGEKQMKKKFLSMAALVLALVMTGCSTGNAKAETPAEDTKADAQTEETTLMSAREIRNLSSFPTEKRSLLMPEQTKAEMMLLNT